MIVVGSGLAGLTTALGTAELGRRTLVVTKDEADENNTRLAQGGMAVTLESYGIDSVDQHVADTCASGAGLCEQHIVRDLLLSSPTALHYLISQGARFDAEADGRLALAQEGGHRQRRIVRAGGDAVGREIQRVLSTAANSVTAKRLEIVKHHCVVDVLLDMRGTVCGVEVLRPGGGRAVLRAPTVVLATGGSGQLFSSTTNPAVATADGLYLALRAGAQLRDMEFIQFHPTALFTGTADGRLPLITEALRGEQAVIIDDRGQRVMIDVHPLADLAPRDVVSAAMTSHMAQRDLPHLALDATHLTSAQWRDRFPTVRAACAAHGINPTEQPIPVVPAAHYQCGGVATDAHGRTGIPGLYAVGEIARTGLHGANRLASNSLLEAIVVGLRATQAITQAPRRTQVLRPASLPRPSVAVPRDGLQKLLQRHCSMNRTAAGLEAVTAFLRDQARQREVRCRRDLEDCALTLAAWTLATAALARRESRGCHRRSDFPQRSRRRQRSLTHSLAHGHWPVLQEPEEQPA
ncbi:L-aspartate oxidase [Streptomyces sp. NPDC018059]|uniref:L-aspartate oxidase n=1 Tax=Streptomyces sp. NPDC018059 TaxID=3365041 RepID=UPI00378ADCC7